MIQLLAEQTQQLQNVCTPLPFKVHFCFCIIATVLYITQAVRKKSKHYIFIMFAIDLTFITQFWTSTWVIASLFAAEVVLLVLAGIFSHRYNRQIKANEYMNRPIGKKDENSNS